MIMPHPLRATTFEEFAQSHLEGEKMKSLVRQIRRWTELDADVCTKVTNRDVQVHKIHPLTKQLESIAGKLHSVTACPR